MTRSAAGSPAALTPLYVVEFQSALRVELSQQPATNIPEMTLTTDTVAALAPDQASLKAASKLTKTAKWPVREFDAASNLVWGECQGSGANPYRTVFDLSDHGYKCTCPSRKFPCKHALALMWMYAEGPGDFSAGTVPEWVTDWLGRRRKTGAKPEVSTDGKSIALARAEEPEKPEDPKAIARREAAAKKRAEETEAALLGLWTTLRTGLLTNCKPGLVHYSTTFPLAAAPSLRG